MGYDEKIEEAARLLRDANNVVVFTGAGISAESGIPTFRGEEGLWKNYRAQDLATPWAFEQDPKKVWEWYDWRRKLISEGKPNAGHMAIAEMERYYDNFHVITQNVDGLHERAGNQNIIELHGNLWRVRCEKENRIFDFTEVPLKEIPPRCECGSLVRPDVVWFGESLPSKELEKAFSLSQQCDIMIVCGTSALIQPAASLPPSAKSNGAHLVEVNIDSTPVSSIADISIFEKAGKVLPEILQKIM